MDLKVASSTKQTLELHLDDVDYSVGEILHHELLKDRRVVFAGVTPPHPLLKRLIMKVQTERADPLKIVVENGMRTMNAADGLLTEARRVFALPEESVK